MVTSAFTRQYISERRVRRAVTQAAKWAATYVAPVALSLGVGSWSAMTLAPAPAIAQSSISVLTNGDQGEAVSRLQDRLAELGFFAGESTGFYGPLTEEAVIRYQEAQGLLADGVAGPETLGTLLPAPIAPQRSGLALDGEQLRTLQAKLASLDFYLGEIDGVYGPQSEAAINSFQSVYALPVTGVVDRRTLATLDRVYAQSGGRLDSLSNNSNPATISVGASTTSVSTTTQISSTSVTLPPAVASGPTLVASIPQTTTITNQLPPPSLPDQRFNNGNLLPPFDVTQPIRQTPQLAVAEGISGSPYIVAVPVKTGGSLAEVRQFSSGAFLAGSKRGTYIQAGAYSSREDAEQATQTLRNRRIDARVVYRPN